MKFGDYKVLKSGRSWQIYCGKNWLTRNPEPERYPCIVEIHFDSDGDSYPEYIYLSNVLRMRDALAKSGGYDL